MLSKEVGRELGRMIVNERQLEQKLRDEREAMRSRKSGLNRWAVDVALEVLEEAQKQADSGVAVLYKHVEMLEDAIDLLHSSLTEAHKALSQYQWYHDDIHGLRAKIEEAIGTEKDWSRSTKKAPLAAPIDTSQR